MRDAEETPHIVKPLRSSACSCGIPQMLCGVPHGRCGDLRCGGFSALVQFSTSNVRLSKGTFCQIVVNIWASCSCDLDYL